MSDLRSEAEHPADNDSGFIPAGTRIGHYEILSELGRGGMAVVYRALDTKLDREVALKSPRPDRPFGERQLKRFLREARTTAKIAHPNVVSVLDVFDHAGSPWMAMELVDGPSLRRELARQGPPEILEIVKRAEGLADALRIAHEQRILHRDITPNNVLIGADGRARLTDFGLAHLFVPPGRESQVTTRSVEWSTEAALAGTPGYLAPEQLLGKPADPRSDLFSLGAVLYEMCAGQAAFRSTGQGDFVDAILHREPPALTRQNYDVPEALEHIVRKALAKRPEERYQSALDMLTDVRALRRRIASEVYSSERAGEKPARTRRAPWLVAGAAVVAAATLLGLWLVGRSDPDPLPRWIPRQLTSDPGWERDPALHPNGNLVVYASDHGGTPDLWLLDLGGGQPLRLTDDPANDQAPAWLPDASAIVFVSDRGGSDSIWKIPPLGGAPMLLVSDAVDPAISPDGTRIAVARGEADGRLRIGVAELERPTEIRMVTREGDGLWDHRQPAWSPDGKTLCYSDFKDLWIADAAGGGAERISDSYGSDENPTWSADGRHVYFASRREGTFALWRQAVGHGGLTRVTLGTGPEGQPDLAADGKRLVYSTFVENPDIVIVDRDSGARAEIPGMRMESTPCLAHDGSRVVFNSNRGGSYDLWSQPLAQGRPDGPPRRLTDHPGSETIPVLSPDGRWVAYGRVFQEQRDIWAVSAEGGVPHAVTSHEALEMHPAWSPEGSRLAFVSDRDGQEHLWVAPIRDGRLVGEPWQLTRGECTDWFPLWLPGGESVAYISNFGSRLEIRVVAVRRDAEPRTLLTHTDLRFLRWDATHGTLLVSGRWEEDRVVLRQVDPATGAVREPDPALVLGHAGTLGDFDVSADGRLMAFVREEIRGDIWVLESQAGAF